MKISDFQLFVRGLRNIAVTGLIIMWDVLMEYSKKMISAIRSHITEYLTPLWLFVFIVVGTSIGLVFDMMAVGFIAGIAAFLGVYLLTSFIVWLLRIKLDKEVPHQKR